MKTRILYLAGIVLIASGCGPKAGGFPTRDAPRAQRNIDRDRLPFEDRDVNPDQLDGIWTIAYAGPHLSIDRLSTDGAGTLEIDLKKGTYTHFAQFKLTKNEKKSNTLELVEAGQVKFTPEGDLLRFTPDRTRSSIRPQHADLAKAMNSHRPRGYCEVASWREGRERYLDEVQCATAFQPAQFAHVKSVTEKELVLEQCRQKNVGGRPALDCTTMVYTR